MDNDQILDDGSLGLAEGGNTLSAGAARSIERAAKWGRYYLYFALAGLILQGLFQVIISVQSPNGAGMIGTIVAGIIGLLFGLALYIYPVVKFWGFTRDAPGGIAAGSTEQFVRGISGLKSTYKYIAIAIFVILGLYALILGGAIIFAGASAFAG